MNKIILSILAVCISCLGFAQQNHQTHNSFICSYYGEPINTSITGFSSSADAQKVIANIIDVIGLEPKFQIRSANIPNAAAVISSGQRYILYNPRFISAINQAAKDKWASIAILAHEIGHHLNGHTLLGSSRPSIELEADQFSGFVLRKMGASLEQAQLSMQIVADVRASRTHPGRNDRLVSIQNGWNKADAQITGKQYVAKAIPSTVQPSQPRPQVSSTASNSRYTLNEKYIQFNVYFFADKTNPYYITTGDNMVTIQGTKLVVLGKVVPSGNRSYPLTIVMNGKKEFYISSSGEIVTPARKQVGYLKTNPRA
jgi:hypothetical protein